MRTIFALLLAVVLGGCATVPPPLAPEVVGRIKRISTISVTAEEFTRQYVGVTVFGNEREQKSIAGWATDKNYEEQLGLAAERVFGATLVRAPYVLAEFAPVNDLNGPWDAPAFWGPNWGKIEAPTKALCAKYELDALLVVARRKSGDLFGGSNQFVEGAGIYTRRSTSLLHLLSIVALLDCRTGKELATRLLVRTTQQPDGKARNGPPTLDLPEELSRIPIPQWTADMDARIRDDLLALPKLAWEDTLRTLVAR
jgi:hypothetical protein